MGGQDVKIKPKVHSDWYRNKDEQTDVSKADWRYTNVKTNIEIVR